MSDLRSTIDHQDYRIATLGAGFTIEQADELIRKFLSAGQKVGKPFILHTIGVPGAGKSTYIRTLDKTNIVVVSFDDVMEAIPNYQQDKKNLGAEEAFGKWEVCAREIGYELLFQAIEKQLNIIFDNTASRPDHVDLMTELKKQGVYKLRFLYFPISEELAIARAAKRERYLPPHYIPERRKKIEALLPAFKALADEYDEYISADQLVATA